MILSYRCICGFRLFIRQVKISTNGSLIHVYLQAYSILACIYTVIYSFVAKKTSFFAVYLSQIHLMYIPFLSIASL